MPPMRMHGPKAKNPKQTLIRLLSYMKPYRVTMDLLNAAGEGCVFLHCLPAFHDLGTVIGRQISEKYGFSSSSYFCRVFREATGFTPLQYRRRPGTE